MRYTYVGANGKYSSQGYEFIYIYRAKSHPSSASAAHRPSVAKTTGKRIVPPWGIRRQSLCLPTSMLLIELLLLMRKNVRLCVLLLLATATATATYGTHCQPDRLFACEFNVELSVHCPSAIGSCLSAAF